jgi:hypothetical protein
MPGRSTDNSFTLDDNFERGYGYVVKRADERERRRARENGACGITTGAELLGDGL